MASPVPSKKIAGPHWEFPLRVAHGRVYLDNTDGLPGEEQIDNPDELVDRWFKLPNGSYRVRVDALLRTEATKSLPDYVISFASVDSITDIPVAANLPGLRQLAGWKPAPTESQGSGFGRWPEAKPDASALPILEVVANAVVVPGMSCQVSMTEAEAESYSEKLGEYFILTFGSEGPAALGYLTSSSSGKGVGKIGFSVEAPVAMTSLDQGRASFRQLEEQAMEASATEIGAFKSAVGEALKVKSEPSSFERERFDSLGEAEGVTSWALMHLPIEPRKRLDIYGKDATTRMRLIREALGPAR